MDTKKILTIALVGCCLLTGAALADSPFWEPEILGLLGESAQEGVGELDQLPQQALDRVGEEVDFVLSSPDVTGYVVKNRGAVVWSEEINDLGASYIAVHFSGFDLPAGASLLVRSPDGSRAWKYEGRGNSVDGTGFWGIPIHGDTAVLELHAKVEVAADAIVIDRYARGFPRALGPMVAEKAICGSDDADWAKCYQSSEATAYGKARAVARLLINGTSACTGWLIGDEGHVMTNQHCIGNSSTAANTSFEFMAEGATCSTSCSSWFACPGTVVATTSTLIKTSSRYDYALVQLPSNVSGTYGFLQLRSSGAQNGERIYIPQHPAAWGKQIAIESSQDSSGFCEVYSLSEPPCSGRRNDKDVGYFCDTQGGSSGSPVLGYSDHQVVALHHCANCPNRGVPIQDVIGDLGSALPNNAVVGGGGPSCKAAGESCSAGSECCSGNCKGKAGAKTCK